MPHQRMGLIGGIGWPSTQDYYVRLNQAVARRIGGLASADLAIRSLDFEQVLLAAETPGAVERLFGAAAGDLQAAGAKVLGVCANTGAIYCAGLRNLDGMTFVAMEDALAAALASARVDRAFLLGTRRLLAHPLFPSALAARGIEAVLPSTAVQEQLDDAIFSELEHFTVGPRTLAALDAVDRELQALGAIDVVLACTELPLAIARRPLPFRTWDTVQIHTDALLEAAFASCA
jgi:aspartate racemase